MKYIFFLVILIGCQQNTSTENPKVAQLKGYRELNFGMSEKSFKSKFEFLETKFTKDISKKTIEVNCKPGDYGLIDGVYFDVMQLHFFEDSLTEVSLRSTKNLYTDTDFERITRLFQEKYGSPKESKDLDNEKLYRWSGGNNSININFSNRFGIVWWSISYRNMNSFLREINLRSKIDSLVRVKEKENI